MSDREQQAAPEAAQPAKAAEFHRLHEAGTFVMPNPWDVGSAMVLAGMGFPALASTSSGAAWASGLPDNASSLEATLAHLRALAPAVAVPVNADFEGGFAIDPEPLHDTVLAATGTGIAGLSIEDSTGDEDRPLHQFELAVDRIAAARAAIDESGTGVLLTARSEGFVAGRPGLDETIRRLRAFAEAGADCLYAPGITTAEQIRAVVEAVSPKPVNLLINAPFITVPEAAELGVRRISVGGALARAAWGGWLGAAREIAATGTFMGVQDLPDVDGMLRARGTA